MLFNKNMVLYIYCDIIKYPNVSLKPNVEAWRKIEFGM